MCGIVAAVFPRKIETIAKLIFYNLVGLQHRGQEAAGIAAVKDGALVSEQGFGMANRVFSEEALGVMAGRAAVGHVRYSTFGKHDDPNLIQPYISRYGFAVAFNGTISDPRQVSLSEDVDATTNDLFLVVRFLELQIERDGCELSEAIIRFLKTCSGAYSMTIITTAGEMFVIRDRYGFRPLQVAEIEYEDQCGYIVSSEDCAFKLFNYKAAREIAPGTILKFSGTEQSIVYSMRAEILGSRMCAFELVYFLRPDSHFAGHSVAEFRERLGRSLFEEFREKIDFSILSEYAVIGVPDSSTHMAIGFCDASGAAFTVGLNKNRYIHRTFIQPTQELRENMVRMKLNTIPEKIRGKRIVLIDDSLIRGTTMKQIVRMIRKDDPSEINVLIACPPVKYPCYFGMDFRRRNEMIANSVSESEDEIEFIRKEIGADNLHFLSPEELKKCLGSGVNPGNGYCTACWDGEYNADIEDII